ncbi:hypothetical protein CBR_g12426 [Chara braunii]|uniref:Uncharacterized protein n=1 Tax=Chara braunii TaxID=69332 RepID=A0A388JSD4_CHABU|nr:hypothetical protein CBR_g12426 [Chara braunii]|eukprot:GBG60690.1 hypothetical protein CBR_g12426 [Chara braunii]
MYDLEFCNSLGTVIRPRSAALIGEAFLVAAMHLVHCLVPTFSENGWYSDLLSDDGIWIDSFPAPARPTQALISLASSRILEGVRIHSTDATPPLISILSFDNWADLLWTASHDKPAFRRLTEDRVTHAPEQLMEDELVDLCVNNNLAIKEKRFIELWGAESDFHAGLIQADPDIPTGLSSSESSDEEGDDSLRFTEEEKQFHAKLLASEKREKVKVIAANQRVEVNKFARNAFLPTVPPRWMERQSRGVDDKLWDLLTFNYFAPIHADSYRFLASLTEQELPKCNEKALTENTDLCRGDFPLTADNMRLPVVGEFDRTKCTTSSTALLVRGFMGPRIQTAIAELKQIWNVGRPYLKCRCVELNKGDCGKNITWFDYVLWYLLSDLHYLFPEAPSLRARTHAFKVLAKTTWRAPILASVVFFRMREIMVRMAHSVCNDPSRTPQNILDEPATMLHKFPRTMAKLILSSRYVRSAEKRKREESSSKTAVKSLKCAKKGKQATLEFYVVPPKDQTTSVVTCTPPSSTITE